MSRSKALMLWPTNASASRLASRFTCTGSAGVQTSTGGTAGPWQVEPEGTTCSGSGRRMRKPENMRRILAGARCTSVVSSAFSLASASSMAPPLRRPAGLLLASRTAASKPARPSPSTVAVCVLGWCAQSNEGSLHACSGLSMTPGISSQLLSGVLACREGVAIQLPDDAEVLEATLLPPVLLQAPKQKSLHATQHCVRPRLSCTCASCCLYQHPLFKSHYKGSRGRAAAATFGNGTSMRIAGRCTTLAATISDVPVAGFNQVFRFSAATVSGGDCVPAWHACRSSGQAVRTLS